MPVRYAKKCAGLEMIDESAGSGKPGVLDLITVAGGGLL
jgi:hypothetical protein